MLHVWKSRGRFALALMIAWLGACDVELAQHPGIQTPRAPQGPRQVEPEACGDGDDEWYGCPGNPCAHGWCFAGKCVGEEVGRDGMLVDPGVCCVDAECLELDP